LNNKNLVNVAKLSVGSSTPSSTGVAYFNGKVGIGTPSPGAKLDIAGNIRLRAEDLIRVSEDSGAHVRTVFGTSIGATPSSQYFSFIQSPDSDPNDGVAIRDYSGSQLVTVLNGGNVGIGTTSPGAKLEVNGNVVQTLNGGHTYASLEPRVPMTSAKTAGQIGISVDSYNTNFPNIAGERDYGTSCSGAKTYSQAVAFAEAVGGRLPTIEEVENDVAKGTGCNYDSTYVWSQTSCGPNSHYVSPGNSADYLSSMPRICLADTSTANVEYVAEVNQGGLPVTVDSNGNIIHMAGKVGIGKTNPSYKLDVAGTANAYQYLVNGTPVATTGSANITSTGSANYIPKFTSSSNVGNSVIYQKSNGYVGIGTNSPLRSLTVSTSSTVPLLVTSSDTSGNYSLVDITNENSGTKLRLGIFSGGIPGLAGAGHVNPDLAIVNGKVGIGTTNPGAKLDVIPSSGVALKLGRISGNPSIKSSDGYLIMDSGGSAAALNWYVSDNVILAHGGGKVGIGTPSPDTNLDLYSASGYTSIRMQAGSDPGMSLGVDSNDGNKFKIGDSYNPTSGTHLTIDQSGKVGIGTTSPSVKLDVAGTIKSSKTVLIGSANITTEVNGDVNVW